MNYELLSLEHDSRLPVDIRKSVSAMRANYHAGLLFYERETRCRGPPFDDLSSIAFEDYDLALNGPAPPSSLPRKPHSSGYDQVSMQLFEQLPPQARREAFRAYAASSTEGATLGQARQRETHRVFHRDAAIDAIAAYISLNAALRFSSREIALLRRSTDYSDPPRATEASALALGHRIQRVREATTP